MTATVKAPVWPRHRVSPDGKRLMICDPPMGIGLSVELKPGWAWMVLSMYRRADGGNKFCSPILVEYGLN